MTPDRPILPPFDPLEVQVASMICFRRQGTPSMAEIHQAMPQARRIIEVVRKAGAQS